MKDYRHLFSQLKKDHNEVYEYRENEANNFSGKDYDLYLEMTENWRVINPYMRYIHRNISEYVIEIMEGAVPDELLIEEMLESSRDILEEVKEFYENN